MATYRQAKPAGAPTWVDLMATDIEAARRFYHAVFGWGYDIGGPEFGGYTTARLGDRMTGGMTPMQPDGPPMPPAWSLYFASDNVQADAARVAGLGGKVLFPPMVVGEFGSMAVCTDPGGVPFGLWQAGRNIGFEVSDEPGSATWYELYSSDAKQSRDFYAALLGASADAMPGGMEYYVLKQGDKQLAGIMQIDPSWGDFHPTWLIYFAVASADQTAAAITSHGGRLMSRIDDSPFGRLAAVADPSGALFKIIQPPAAS